jgi:hypothetical protein
MFEKDTNKAFGEPPTPKKVGVQRVMECYTMSCTGSLMARGFRCCKMLRTLAL